MASGPIIEDITVQNDAAACLEQLADAARQAAVIVAAHAVLAWARAEFAATAEPRAVRAMAVLEDTIGRYERIRGEGEHGLATWHEALARVEQQIGEARNDLIQAIAEVRGEHAAAEIRGDTEGGDE